MSSMLSAQEEWSFLMPQKIIRAAIYIRISDEKQEKNYSVAFQKGKCLDYCRDNNHPVKDEHIFVDTYTGKVWRQRKSLQLALAAAKRHEFDILVMYKLDRLSREPDDQIILREQFKYYGVRIITLFADEHADDDSLAGEIVRRVYAWKAKIERQDIVQRTQDGLRQRVKEGKLLAGRRALYGYRWNDPEKKAFYVICEEEAKIVRLIFAWASEGLSLRKISFRLTEEGIPTPDGKTLWRATSVRNILANEFYIGNAVAYRTKTEFTPEEGNKTTLKDESEWVSLPAGTVPQIVDESVFQLVKRQLEINKINAQRNNPNPEDSLLRCGRAICGYCGHKMTVDRGRSEGKLRMRYKCPRAKKGYNECSGNPHVNVPLLDDLVWKEVLACIRNPIALEQNLAQQRTSDPTKDELVVLDNLLQDVAQRIKNLTETLETTPPSNGKDLLLLRLDELATQKKGYEEKRDSLLRTKVNWQEIQASLVTFKAWCEETRKRFDDPDFTISYQEKLNALYRLGIVVTVYRPGHKPHFTVEFKPAELRTSLGAVFFTKQLF